MPLLAYCIVKQEAAVTLPRSGVQQTKIQSVSESGLVALTSEYHPQEGADVAKASALAFNEILQELLQRTTIIPFRFPTIVDSESELSAFLREHSEEYRKALDRLWDAVQMEINLRLGDPPSESNTERSGTEYLTKRHMRRRRLVEIASLFRERSASHSREWRQREGGNSIRCFALVPRTETTEFLGKMKGFQLPPDIYARITGPWPATEFLKEKE